MWGRRVGAAPFLLLAAILAPVPPVGAAGVGGIPSLCLFRHVTGLPCPGCGMTRSVVCCVHGAWADAVTFHPLGPAVFAALLIVTIARIASRRGRWRPPSRWMDAAMAGVVTLLLGVWFARLGGILPAPP